MISDQNEALTGCITKQQLRVALQQTQDVAGACLFRFAQPAWQSACDAVIADVYRLKLQFSQRAQRCEHCTQA